MRCLEFDDVRLTIDEFGSPGEPPVLLIAGATQSMDWWTPDFCERLAAEGFYVLRYDQRDTGGSTTSVPGAPDYTGKDLATDPLRILDDLGIGSAHLIGLSMGGGIAQYLSVLVPERVRTLTLIETSPAGGDVKELPPPQLDMGAAETALPEVRDWNDAASVINYRVEGERPYAGSLGFDEERIRTIATLEVGRTGNMEAALTNHFVVAEGVEADPSAITQSTMVIHSDSDPLFPLGHGEALARMIPKSTLLRVEGMGHEAPPPQVWGVVIPAMAAHMHGY